MIIPIVKMKKIIFILLFAGRRHGSTRQGWSDENHRPTRSSSLRIQGKLKKLYFWIIFFLEHLNISKTVILKNCFSLYLFKLH